MLLRKGFESLIDEAGTRDAAQVAFFLVMSFPAILLLLVWCFSAVLADDSVRQSIVDSIVDTLPLADPSDRRQVEALLDDVAAGAGGLGVVGIVALIYSASGAIGALRHAVNRAWGEPDTRPYMQGKVLDVGLTLVVAPAIIVSLGLTLSGSLADSIGDQPWLAAVAQYTVTELVPLLVLFALLAWLFRVLPVARRSTRSALIGAAVALPVTVFVEWAARAYFAGLGDRTAVYGTLGVLLAVVFSAYLVAIAIVYGAHVAAHAARLPSAAAIDRAIEDDRLHGMPAGRFIWGEVRGLFVRVKPPPRTKG